MHKSSVVLSLLLFIVFKTNVSQAQQSLIYQNPDKEYQKGLELFEKQKYGAAQHAFSDFLSNSKGKDNEIRTQAEYYQALCALELFNSDAEYQVITFCNKHRESARVQELSFRLAKYHFNRKKYDNAIAYLLKVDKYSLTPVEFAEYAFDLGYSYFMKEDYEKARLAFYEIKDIDTKYTPPANYYYSHINYSQKNYETALQGFLRLVDDENFGKIVPYYIAQIYYLKADYDSVISFATPLLDSVIESRVAEMARIIGESYYKKDRFKESIPFFEKYFDHAKNTSKEDKYELAYAYYINGDYKNASQLFEPITGLNSLLSQSALYHLGDCYVHLGDKNSARMAFEGASKLDFDKKIKEDALFNYAVITYELSYGPFNETINAFNQYLQLYPNSRRTDEAYNYLGMAYLGTHNYKDAITFLDKIRNKDERTRQAYQKVAYYRGLELFNNLTFDQAIEMFDKSLKFASYDNTIEARSWYWRGETNYRLSKYDDAIEDINNFLSVQGVDKLIEYKPAYYAMAYCYFNKKDYAEAGKFFKKFVTITEYTKDKETGDAFNRLGDVSFINKKYWEAIGYYEQAISINAFDPDYALFQKGFCLGLLNRHERKVEMLNQLISKYPASVYVDDSYFELGKSYVSLSNRNKAIEYYKIVIDSFPTSSYVKKALVQLGLEYYNDDKYEQALENYKKVVKEYPGTQESRNALTGIKTIYLDRNNVNAYVDFVNSLGGIEKITSTQQDSLTYTAAENLYMAGDCDKSRVSFKKYIENFPKGDFLLNAHYYKSDCNLKNKEYQDALLSLKYIIEQPKNAFTEQALIVASGICFNDFNYVEAVKYYQILENIAEVKNNIFEARLGLMRCYFKQKDYHNAITYAEKVKSSDKVPSEISREAIYNMASSWLSLSNEDSALIEFKKIAVDVKNVEGAEAKYRISEILVAQDKLKDAEKEIFEFIAKTTPHHYWIARSFLLLSDIYVKNNDAFQARETLKSIIENYEDKQDGIVKEAKEKLALISGSQDQQNDSQDSLK
jgi:TolA-binding protein